MSRIQFICCATHRSWKKLMYESVKKRRCRSNIGTGPCVAIAELDTEARPETEFCWSIRTGLFVGSNSERKHARSQHVTESPVPGTDISRTEMLFISAMSFFVFLCCPLGFTRHDVEHSVSVHRWCDISSLWPCHMTFEPFAPLVVQHHMPFFPHPTIVGDDIVAVQLFSPTNIPYITLPAHALSS